MADTIYRYINYPLSFRSGWKNYLRFVVIFWLYLVVFLGLYRPFFMSFLNSELLWFFVVRISTFTVLLMFVNYYLVKLLIPKLTVQWNIWKEAVWVALHFIPIGIFNVFLVLNTAELSFVSPSQVFFSTCLVGIIPSGLDVAYRALIKPAKEILPIVYVQSDGNYVHVYKKGDSEIEREMIRSSLTDFHSLYKYDLIRTHRSYLVNLRMISRIHGNSNGGQVILKSGEKIPYSRSYFKELKRKLP